MNIFSTRDPQGHRNLKRKVAIAYTLSNLLQSEEAIDSCSTMFMSCLSEFASRQESVDLGAWLQYYAFDVVGELNFASKLGFLEQGMDVDGMMKAIEVMLAYGALCGQVPEYHKYLLGNPLFTMLMPAMELWDRVLVFTLKAINSRATISRNGELVNADEGGHDMLSRWASVKSSDPNKMTSRDIVVDLSANFLTGSHTTAIALRAVVYFLCRHPSTMAKALTEIDNTDKNGALSNPISYKEATTALPYMGAVVKESMRLHPSIGLIMERHTPKQGATICGQHIPGGTIVGINPWVIGRNEDVFLDAEKFKPERWLDASEGQLREMESLLSFNFGAGSRACLGKHVSLIEIHKIIPQLLRTFRVELTHPEKEWEVCNHWFVQQKGLICTVTQR